MIKDSVYVFDKLTKVGTNFGEIQSDFNMSFVIDGTKDSMSVIVLSYQKNAIEPYSIFLHAKTNTWWIVKHDKVERYANENGFIYTHNLDLLGAIELLNARDLTDCGFNSNTYYVGQFIDRLFKLSSFNEFPITYQGELALLDRKVDFIKTFENYTLLSALRELLDSYNCSCKLNFAGTYNSVNDAITLTDALFKIIPKTGNKNVTHQENDFNDVRETKTLDKDSFGTTVVSNAENVISSIDKIFPTAGGIRASSTEYKIKPENAVIRLPSKAFKVNSLKLVTTKAPLYLTIAPDHEFFIWCCPLDTASIENAFNEIKRLVENVAPNSYDDFLIEFEKQKDLIAQNILKASTITLFNGNYIDPITGKIVKGDGVPYLAEVTYFSKDITGLTKGALIVCDKETRESLPDKYQGIYWERGSNIISGFDAFTAVTGSQQTIYTKLKYTDLQVNSPYYEYFVFVSGDDTIQIWTGTNSYLGVDELHFHFGPSSYGEGDLFFIINYTPMSDIKIKIDNDRDKKDIQLYNQNGKLTDSVALSKLINSYSKEISSDSITKYQHYFSFNDVPSVGDLVIIDNEEYVINNISCTFTQNETNLTNDFNYYIECEITMSKYVTTKSLMVNPNTNIRDYGIPQNYNVKRKQLYRDFYQLSYSPYDDRDNSYYIASQYIFNFAHYPNELTNFVCVIKCKYDEEIGGNPDASPVVSPNDEWYYQLESTNYYLNKMFYVVLDFQDNNIIGYGSQNIFSGFDITRILNGLTDNLNTPISYVDSKGKVTDIDILFCTNDEITSIYNGYLEDLGETYDGSLYNYSVFIPEEIYDLAAENNTFELSLQDYNKDALEVPVFEYACQIEDSENVLIGDNILRQIPNTIYFYSYVEGDNLNQYNAYTDNTVQSQVSPLAFAVNDGADIVYNQTYNTLRVRLYQNQSYLIENNEFVNTNQVAFTSGKDYAFFRHAYNIETQEETIELMFVAKKVPSSNISDGQVLTIEINHYKLN